MSSQTPLLRVIPEHTPVVYPCGAIVKCGFRSSDCLSLAGGLRQRELRAQSGRRVALDDDRWRRRRRRRPHRATESPRLQPVDRPDQTAAGGDYNGLHRVAHSQTHPLRALPCLAAAAFIAAIWPVSLAPLNSNNSQFCRTTDVTSAVRYTAYTTATKHGANSY